MDFIDDVAEEARNHAYAWDTHHLLACAGATGTPVCALGELQDCDAIKDTGNRMACLQAHISHLEQTLLSLSTEIVDLRHELKVKLAADGVYKLQYVGKGELPRLRR